MGTETMQQVETLVTSAGRVDNDATIDTLWALVEELRARVERRFSVERDLSTMDCDDEAASSGAHLHLSTYAGDELDWMVVTRLVNPTLGFSNMHLTLWLGPQSPVPHLIFAFGTMPNPFFLIDYLPRRDLRQDVEALADYYDPLNAEWIAVHEQPFVHPFVSRGTYVREVLSPAGLSLTTEPTPEAVTYMADRARAALDRWLGWVDSATPSAPEVRAEQATLDLQLRRSCAELDPARYFAQRFWEPGRSEVHLRALWGAERELPRAGGFANDTSRPCPELSYL